MKYSKSSALSSSGIYIPICFYFNLYPMSYHSQYCTFTFQYVSILIKYCTVSRSRKVKIYIPICFYFNLFGFESNIRFSNIYIPICFYFNPSPEFPLLFYLISPLSVDQPKFTNILPYLLH